MLVQRRLKACPKLVFVIVVIERHADQAVFFIFQFQDAGRAKSGSDFLEKIGFPLVVGFEMRALRFDEELIGERLSVFLRQEQYKVWLEGLTIGKIVDGKMPFVAEQVNLFVLRL